MIDTIARVAKRLRALTPARVLLKKRASSLDSPTPQYYQHHFPRRGPSSERNEMEKAIRRQPRVQSIYRRQRGSHHKNTFMERIIQAKMERANYGKSERIEECYIAVSCTERYDPSRLLIIRA